MTPVFAARRRAEEFAALVEDPSAVAAGDARYDALLGVVTAMRETTAPAARPEFVADLRARLMAEAETALVPVDTSRLTLPARRPARERRIAAAVGGLALVGATTSMAVAAQSALPGDALYPVKRAIEDVHAGISVGEGQKGATLLDSAGGRLDEVTALTSGDHAGDDLVVADTLNDFTDQAAQASDLLLAEYDQTGDQAAVERLRDFTAHSLDQLKALESVVPTDARDELMHAAQVLIAIDDAAQQACPSCAGSGITRIPPVFAPAAATQIPFSVQPAGTDHGTRHQGATGQGGTPHLPSVSQGSLPPGSVTDPVTGGGTGGPSGGRSGDSPTDPITSLTNGLTGGGSGSTTDVPGVKDTVKGVKDGVGEILGGVDGVTGGATSGVTDGVTGGVTDTLP